VTRVLRPVLNYKGVSRLRSCPRQPTYLAFAGPGLQARRHYGMELRHAFGDRPPVANCRESLTT
jgi:hypothetical protein